jgi:hypothetical protein
MRALELYGEPYFFIITPYIINDESATPKQTKRPANYISTGNFRGVSSLMGQWTSWWTESGFL